MKKRIITLIILFMFILISNLYGEQKIMDYGFENWTGDRSTTAGYPFSSNHTEYCKDHDESSEVVTHYDPNGVNWTPHSGSYFFLRNDSYDHPLDPNVAGITIGHVADNGNIGRNGSACSTNALDLGRDITTGEVFIRFWARHNRGFRTIEDGGRCKWIRVLYESSDPNDPGDGQVFMHLTTGGDEITSQMYFYCKGDGGWLPRNTKDPNIQPKLTNAYDGQWHKYAFHVDYNNGVIRGWYDVNIETIHNATKEWTASDGTIGTSAEGPGHFIIQGNFSAKHATEECFHALDDIEIWDGIPTPPKVPSGIWGMTKAWAASNQTGQTNWNNSNVMWCVRILVEGASITESGTNIILGFQGRDIENYIIKKVSIAERDINGTEGDAIDATWKKVIFNGKSEATWENDHITIPAATIKYSDPTPLILKKNSDYYVTFLLESPSTYLIAPNSYKEFYFESEDHTEDIDWSDNGHSVYYARLHALSSLQIKLSR